MSLNLVPWPRVQPSSSGAAEMFSKRTKVSLAQLLMQLQAGDVFLLLVKHDLVELETADTFHPHNYDRLSRATLDAILGAPPDKVAAIVEELVATSGAMRAKCQPKYPCDERIRDFERTLQLDGYRIDDHKKLLAIDENIGAAPPVDDDLVDALRSSGLKESEQIIVALENSANDFRKNPPDLNGCLANARVALETLCRSIASRLMSKDFDEIKWGPGLDYLSKSGFITKDEDAGLAGVYRFVSPGAHKALPDTASDLARVGRSLAAFMSYFLLQRLTANS